jgi:hypothetical protein
VLEFMSVAFSITTFGLLVTFDRKLSNLSELLGFQLTPDGEVFIRNIVAEPIRMTYAATALTSLLSALLVFTLILLGMSMNLL